MITVHEVGAYPALARGRRTRVELWREGQVISDVAPGGEGLVCLRMGRRVPREEWAGTPTAFGDILSFIPVPQGGIGGFLVTFIIIPLITAAASYGIARLMAPKAEEFEHSEDTGTTITGITNTARNGQPIAIIYGEHVAAGNVISAVIDPAAVSPTTGLFYGNALDVVIGVCEGEIDEFIETRIDGNLVDQYGGTVQVFYRTGTVDQPPLGGSGTTSTFPIGLELLEGAGDPFNPATWTGGLIREYTTQEPCDRVRLNILFPEGLVAIHHTSGAAGLINVQWQTRFRVVGSGDPGWTPWVTHSHTDNRRAPFLLVTELFLPTNDDLYDVQVRRWSVAEDFPNYFTRIDLDSVGELVDVPFTYPGLACARVRVESTDQLQGSLPTITHRIRGRKITKWDGFDPDTPTFIDAAPYDNPAWVVLDMILDTEYGLGRWFTLANINLPAWLDWANWNDELVSDGRGGSERRNTYNAVIDGEGTNALDRIRQVCSTCRTTLVCVGDLISPKVSKVRTPSQEFGMGTIRPGSWRSDWISTRKRPTRLEVDFLNAALGYQRDTASIDDELSIQEGLPQRVERVDLLGITRESHALREARYLLNLNRLSRMVSFDVDIDAIACEVGDIVRVSHDVPGWGISGRLAANGLRGSEFTVDQDVTIETGVTYEVIVRHFDNIADVRTVTSSPGAYPAGSVLTVDPSFTHVTAKGDPYALGKISAAAKLVEIRNIRTLPDLGRQIEGVLYDERIHDDSIGQLEDLPISTLPDPGLLPACPSGLTCQQVTVSAGGGASYSVQVSWQYPTGGQVAGAVVYYRDLVQGNPGGINPNLPVQWAVAGTVAFPQNSFIHGPVTPGIYEYTVAVTNPFGGSRPPGSCSTFQIEVSPSTGVAPEAPTGITVAHAGDDLVIEWQPVTNVPVSHYLVRRGVRWVGSLDMGQSPSTQLVTQRWAPTQGSSIQERIFVRAVGFAGVIGHCGELTLPAGGLPVWLGGTVDQSDHAANSWPDGVTNLQEIGARLELVLPGDPGIYVTEALDTGATDSYRVGAVVHMTAHSALDWATATTVTWRGPVGAAQSWHGSVDPAHWENAFKVEFQASQNGVGWSDWAPLVTQTVTGATIGGSWVSGVRYFRFRVTLTPISVGYGPYLEQLFITAEAR